GPHPRIGPGQALAAVRLPRRSRAGRVAGQIDLARRAVRCRAVLSPFLLGKSAPPHALRIGLRLAGALVLAASLPAGLTAITRDLAQSSRSARSAFSAEDLRQFRYVREQLADGEALLVLATKTDRWHTCLWQRALYPRNPAIVRYKNTPAPPQIEE